MQPAKPPLRECWRLMTRREILAWAGSRRPDSGRVLLVELRRKLRLLSPDEGARARENAEALSQAVHPGCGLPPPSPPERQPTSWRNSTRSGACRLRSRRPRSERDGRGRSTAKAFSVDPAQPPLRRPRLRAAARIAWARKHLPQPLHYRQVETREDNECAAALS